MNQAFLLGTIERVIDGVKIRNQNTLNSIERRLGQLALAALGIEVSDLVQVGENPNIGSQALDADVRFVGMHQLSGDNPLENLLISLAVTRRHISLPKCE